MLSFNFDDKALARIAGKLDRLKANVLDQEKLFFTIEHYAKSYRNGVIKVMGTVSAATADGTPTPASPTITFSDLSANPRWAALSPTTITRKQKKSNGRVAFWYNTGDAFEAVARSVLVGSYKSKDVISVFAGIDKADNPDAYEHAIRTEFGAEGPSGDSFPARALFTIANELFLQKRAEIVSAVQRAIMDGVDWGR